MYLDLRYARYQWILTIFWPYRAKYIIWILDSLEELVTDPAGLLIVGAVHLIYLHLIYARYQPMLAIFLALLAKYIIWILIKNQVSSPWVLVKFSLIPWFNFYVSYILKNNKIGNLTLTNNIRWKNVSPHNMCKDDYLSNFFFLFEWKL